MTPPNVQETGGDLLITVERGHIALLRFIRFPYERSLARSLLIHLIPA